MPKSIACNASKGALLPLALFLRQARGLGHSGLPLLPWAPINCHEWLKSYPGAGRLEIGKSVMFPFFYQLTYHPQSSLAPVHSQA
jgi:hypothetical protein